MFLATETNHIINQCASDDLELLLEHFLSKPMEGNQAKKMASCLIMAQGMDEPMMRLLLTHCKENNIYITPQTLAVVMSKNNKLSLKFLLEQVDRNVFNALKNPNVPAELVIKKIEECGPSYFFLLRNENINLQNAKKLLENDLMATLHHASGHGISFENYSELMNTFFDYSATYSNSSRTILLSSPFLMKYLDENKLTLSNIISNFSDGINHKTLSEIVSSESIHGSDFLGALKSPEVFQQSPSAYSFALETFDTFRYSMGKDQARNLLLSISQLIQDKKPQDVRHCLGLFTYLILLNLDFNHYDEDVFEVWTQNLNNPTSKEQSFFCPTNDNFYFTPQKDHLSSLIKGIDNVNPNNNAKDLILKGSQYIFPSMYNFITSLLLNDRLEISQVTPEIINKHSRPRL